MKTPSNLSKHDKFLTEEDLSLLISLKFAKVLSGILRTLDITDN